MTSLNTTQSSTNLFRRLAWNSTIPLCIKLADSQGSSIDRYYLHAPRYTYLPLLLPEIRENLVELALDDGQLAEVDEKEWWFEEEVLEGTSDLKGQGACRWHWPLDLISLTSQISHPYPSSSQQHTPLTLLLHLKSPPNDQLLMSNDTEACRSQYVNQVKEADFVRWRNTNKVTGLRRADLEAGWEGIVADDYDLHTRMSSRILPLPIPVSSLPSSTQTSGARPASTEPRSTGKPDNTSSYAARGLPIKIYLPDGAPVIQENISPLSADGTPQTILQILHTHLPLLFPTLDNDNPYPLAVPLILGVETPPSTEVAWLAACLTGADGWVRVGVALRG